MAHIAQRTVAAQDCQAAWLEALETIGLEEELVLSGHASQVDHSELWIVTFLIEGEEDPDGLADVLAAERRRRRP